MGRLLLEEMPADLGIAGTGGMLLSGDPHPAALSSSLAVADCAVSSVAACLVAAADLAFVRTGRTP